MDKRRLVLEAKQGKPCADCGVFYPPYVMEFDHLPEHTKLAVVGKCSTADIRAELAKCELVCRNCHAERTHQRRRFQPKRRRATRAPRHVPARMAEQWAILDRINSLV